MTAPLGKNIGGYDGDTIDINDVLQRTLAAAQAHGWSIENFPNTGDLKLYGLRRLASEPRLAIYISAGIHGDEPAGPLAMLELIQANAWPSGWPVKPGVLTISPGKPSGSSRQEHIDW